MLLYYLLYKTTTYLYICSVPEFIPMDATAVYLDGNNFNSNALINDEFIGRKHLTSLYLNNSQISIISNQTLKGMVFIKLLCGSSQYLIRSTIFGDIGSSSRVVLFSCFNSFLN